MYIYISFTQLLSIYYKSKVHKQPRNQMVYLKPKPTKLHGVGTEHGTEHF